MKRLSQKIVIAPFEVCLLSFIIFNQFYMWTAAHEHPSQCAIILAQFVSDFDHRYFLITQSQCCLVMLFVAVLCTNYMYLLKELNLIVKFTLIVF